MAKKSKEVNADGNVDINAKIKQEKKKMMTMIAIICVVVLGVGGFFGYKVMSSSNAKKAEEQKELEALDLKDYPVDEKESSKIYTRDIKKQTYVLKNGAILFEGTIVFHNKLCANLYNGISDRKEQASTEPDLAAEDMFGDKLMKDALNRYLQSTDKNELSSAEKLAEGLKDAINKQFVDTFGHEIVKNILVTNHIVQ